MVTHLAPITGHDLRVTNVVVRAFVDCTCDTPPAVQYASMRQAERAALRHYITHAPVGRERARAARLLGQTEKTS